MRIAPVAAALACSVLVLPRLAQAQDTEATATSLFDQGRNLMTQHRYAEACPKLAESQHLAPSGGTLLNLAECYEHTGQTASAWAAWKDAAARANAAGKASAEKSALARAAALEATLAKLTIAVPPDSDVPGLEVKRDGVPVGHAEFGNALAVDPGTHVIEASAPRKKAWSAKVDVVAKQTDARVTVSLTDDVEASAPQPLASTPATGEGAVTALPPGGPAGGASGWGTQKTVAVVVGAAGVVGLAIGTVFGLSAKSSNDEAQQNCRTSTLCTAKGLSLTSDAKNAATVSTIAFAVGGAAVAAGAVLWLTAPHASSTTGMAIRATPIVTGSYGGLALDAVW
jgi:hypothetical protein